MSKRRNTLTRWIEDMVDDTKDFVDDVLDRAKDVENDARDAVKDVVDDDEDDYVAGSTGEIHAALAELTAKVNQLAELQLAAASAAPAASTPATSSRRSAAA